MGDDDEMDYGQLIKDALKYPLSDYKKFLILAIPNLIISVILCSFTYIGTKTNNMSYEYISTTFSTNEALTLSLAILLALLILLMLYIISNGISIQAIAESLAANQLPDFNIQKFFVSGLKNIIVTLGYVALPLVIYFIILALIATLFEVNELAAAILMVVFFIISTIALVILYVVYLIATARLAITNSLSDAFNISRNYEIASTIGKINIFAITLALTLILFIPLIIGSIFESIHILGIIISYGIIETYVMLANSRLTASLYMEKDRNRYHMNQDFSWHQNQQYPKNMPYHEDESILIPKEETTNNMDFHNLNQNNNENNKKQE